MIKRAKNLLVVAIFSVSVLGLSACSSSGIRALTSTEGTGSTETGTDGTDGTDDTGGSGALTVTGTFSVPSSVSLALSIPEQPAALSLVNLAGSIVPVAKRINESAASGTCECLDASFNVLDTATVDATGAYSSAHSILPWTPSTTIPERQRLSSFVVPPPTPTATRSSRWRRSPN